MSTRESCTNCGEPGDVRVGDYCGSCLPEIAEKWSEHVSSTKINYTLARYGLTLADHGSMFADQDGLCVICRDSERSRKDGGMGGLVVDHHHDSGRVRGLLCGRCNAAIGLLAEREDWLKRAAHYVRRRMNEERFLAVVDKLRTRIEQMESRSGRPAPDHMYRKLAHYESKVERLQSLPVAK